MTHHHRKIKIVWFYKRQNCPLSSLSQFSSTMVVKHVDWIKQVAMKGSCNPVEDGIYYSKLIFQLNALPIFNKSIESIITLKQKLE